MTRGTRQRTRGGGGTEDPGGGDVVAAGGLAAAVGAVVERHPQLAPVARDLAPRLPLRRFAEPRARPRRDVARSAPGLSAVGRDRVEDVVVAGRGRGRGSARAGGIRVVPEVGPDDVDVPGAVHR